MNELDPIFSVTVDLVPRDDDIQRRPTVALHPDLDTVIPVVANDVVLDSDVHGIVEIDAVIAVVLERAKLYQPTAAVFVVHAVARVPHHAVEQVELGARGDAVVAVLDGEALDGRPVFGATRDPDHEGRAAAV